MGGLSGPKETRVIYILGRNLTVKRFNLNLIPRPIHIQTNCFENFFSRNSKIVHSSILFYKFREPYTGNEVIFGIQNPSRKGKTKFQKPKTLPALLFDRLA